MSQNDVLEGEVIDAKLKDSAKGNRGSSRKSTIVVNKFTLIIVFIAIVCLFFLILKLFLGVLGILLQIALVVIGFYLVFSLLRSIKGGK